MKQTLRASVLPRLAECLRFVQSGRAKPQMEAGTDRHTALAGLLKEPPDRTMFNLLPEEDQQAILWAEEYIRLKAPMSDYPLEIEIQVTATVGFDIEIPGHADIICGNHIFDLKWRYGDYDAQMACYALARFQSFDSPDSKLEFVTTHLLYGAFKKAVTHGWIYDEAMNTVEDIVLPAMVGEEAEPQANEWCEDCANATTCPALLKPVQAVVAGREDWHLETFHSSQITKPSEMAKALLVARQIAPWCEAVEHHAREMVVKQGITLPGFKTQTRSGKRFVKDIPAAYERSGLTPEQFLPACTVSVTKLEEQYAKAKEIAKAKAKRVIAETLGDCIDTASEVLMLVREKGDKNA